jgi:hypothetical protein
MVNAATTEEVPSNQTAKKPSAKMLEVKTQDRSGRAVEAGNSY